ncbi:MAG: type IV toxin-antitoxin system AbiEi family antitoxin domain-containing protein [Thermoflexales bacterium]
MPPTELAQLLQIARRHTMISARDATGAGIHSQMLTRLVVAGVLERMARGQYRLAGRPVTERHALVVAARAGPRGVICLLSALDFHGIGTQLPADIWIAVERGTRAPAISQLPLQVVHFSAAAFSDGIEIHRIEGEAVRIYGVAKTLADLFKFRNRIGLDVALEALRDAWQRRAFTMAALDRAARACRVAQVMRPYIEAVVA